MRDLEHKLQCLCVEWFRYWYPKGTIFAIPNGGARNVVTAAKLKAEGVLAGVPDLCVPMARCGFHGLYIELKNGKKGVVRDSNVHKEVIHSILDFAPEIGLTVMGLDFSPIKGPEGNIEYICHMKNCVCEGAEIDVDAVVAASHEAL